MTALAAVLAAMITVTGLVILVAWARDTLPESTGGRRSSTRLWTTMVDNATRHPGSLARLGVAAALTVALTASTGWPVMLAIVPFAVLGLPRLLAEPPQDDITLLQALDRWIRGMTATMATGTSITDALRLSARQAPPLLAGPLALLVKRLDDRWSPDQALLALADSLDSADADAVVASLVLAVRRGGTGATVTLSALADSLQDRLRALREIESERAKPRIVVRQVTIITSVVMGAAMLLGRDFFAPYSTPLGQVILAALIAAYAGSIAMLRRMTVPRRRARILGAGS